MNKKKLTCLILSLGLSLSLAGCGCGKTNDGNNTAGNVIEEGAANIVDNITDTTMSYNASEFRRDLEKRGAKVEETEASQSHFSIDNKDYTIDGERISVYEYDEDAASTLKNDLSTVTNNGATINNKDVKWNKKAHIYKKGRIVVVYDGDNEKVLKVLNDTLGNSLLK